MCSATSTDLTTLSKNGKWPFLNYYKGDARGVPKWHFGSLKLMAYYLYRKTMIHREREVSADITEGVHLEAHVE